MATDQAHRSVVQQDRLADQRELKPILHEATDSDTEVVCDLMHEYLQWAIERLRDEYRIEWPPIDRADTLAFVEKMRRPDGAVIVAELDGTVVGVGGFRRLEPGAAEIKRMYVTLAARGRHVGSAILDRLLHEARLDGNRVVRLDTLRFMTEAQRLYRSRGFTQRAPYAGTEIPAALHRYWLFFERRLD